jgi:hypothetical protein
VEPENTMSAPLTFVWDGDTMMPVASCRRAANATFVVGERYRMEVVEERSQRSHSHYFASIHEMWASLPDEKAVHFPTAVHLRKFALIRCGYSDQRQIVCASKAEAQRIAGFIKPMDEYAVVTHHEAVVSVFTAQSQSRKAMGHREFQDSKDRVLDYIAGLLGVERASVPQARAA